MQTNLVRGRRANLQRVGWELGTLECEFKGGRRYHYGGVPEVVKDKLARSPFPDSLFQKIVRGKFVSQRIDNLPPSRPYPLLQFTDEELPF